MILHTCTHDVLNSTVQVLLPIKYCDAVALDANTCAIEIFASGCHTRDTDEITCAERKLVREPERELMRWRNTTEQHNNTRNKIQITQLEDKQTTTTSDESESKCAY